MGVTKLNPRAPKPAYAHLWPWERATVPESQLAPGWFPAEKLAAVTWLAMGVMLMILSPTAGWPMAWMALPLARLVALDLTTHTLPDIYTLPLLAVGLAHAWVTGSLVVAVGAVVAVALLMMLAGLTVPALRQMLGKEPGPAGIGGGDVKLLLALFAWLPPAEACFAVAVGCVAWLPLAFLYPRRAQPFGVAIALGWVAVLALPSVLP